MREFGLQGTNKRNIVVDCDEVLVRISHKWVHLMHVKENFDYFSQLFRLSKDFSLGRDYEKVLQRPEYYLDKWLIRNDVLNNHSLEDFNEARRELVKLYTDSEDYYGDLPPTNFANSLSIIGRNSAVDKITIVSKVHKGNEDLDNSKIAFIKNLFNGMNHKVDIYLVDIDGEKKSDVINQLDNVGLVYEDELENIKDIITNSEGLSDMDIMIPSYGYNGGLEQKYYNLAAERNINIKYYYDM